MHTSTPVISLFYQECVCLNDVSYQMAASTELQILGRKGLAVQDFSGQLAARQPQCIHRKEEEKMQEEKKKSKERKKLQVQLCTNRVYLLCYLVSTSKHCAEIHFGPRKDSFRHHIQREWSESHDGLITARIREMGKPRLARHITGMWTDFSSCPQHCLWHAEKEFATGSKWCPQTSCLEPFALCSVGLAVLGGKNAIFPVG